MSAEGILGDPCIFYRHSVSLCPCPHCIGSKFHHPSSSCSIVSLEREYCQKSEIGNGSASQEEKRIKTNGRERKEIIEMKIFPLDNKIQIEADAFLNRKEISSGHDSNKKDLFKFEEAIDEKYEKEKKSYLMDTDLGSKIEIKDLTEESESFECDEVSKTGELALDFPDRATLFAEYCFLSEMYFDAGGWRGLEIQDHLFGEGEGEEEGECHSSNADNDANSNDDNGDDDGDDNGIISNDDHSHNNKRRCHTPTSTAASDAFIAQRQSTGTGRGEKKQIETARQHLFWMLEKKGHGRTVRFMHLGSYKRHTDLLTRIKNTNSLLELAMIARKCLGGVFSSNVYVNDQYN